MRTDKEKAYMGMLAFIVIVATFYLGKVLLTSSVPPENKDILNVALGMILGLSNTVIGYYFGSSKSSSDKTDLFTDKTDIRMKIVPKEENNNDE